MRTNHGVTLLLALIALPCRNSEIGQKNANCWEGIQSFLLDMLSRQTTSIGVSGNNSIHYLSLSWNAILYLDLSPSIPVLMTFYR